MHTKQKLSEMEHKLKMQQEQHHSSLQESLSNEQALSEYRLSFEKSMVDTNKEIQRLRSNLNLEEGKVLALESRVVKLDGKYFNDFFLIVKLWSLVYVTFFKSDEF